MEAFSDLGVYWDAEMTLRRVDTDEKYRGKSAQVLSLISPYVQHLLKTSYNMQEIWIPSDAHPQANIFVSRDWNENAEKALLLIQGAGEVRAGIWSRSVCVSDSLYRGSMLPCLDYAQKHGFSVIIFNPNYIQDPAEGTPIPGLDNPISHSSYVWEQFVRNSPARDLYIIGHSCGGVVSYSLIQMYENEFQDRVRAIALTDSVHSKTQRPSSLFQRIAVNWKASSKPLDTYLSSPETSNNDCTNLSAGHPEHAYTTPAALESIFAFIEGRPYIK